MAAAAWLGVVAAAGKMGAMPGTTGVGLLGFIGIWALMMAAMMLNDQARRASRPVTG